MSLRDLRGEKWNAAGEPERDRAVRDLGVLVEEELDAFAVEERDAQRAVREAEAARASGPRHEHDTGVERQARNAARHRRAGEQPKALGARSVSHLDELAASWRERGLDQS